MIKKHTNIFHWNNFYMHNASLYYIISSFKLKSINIQSFSIILFFKKKSILLNKSSTLIKYSIGGSSYFLFNKEFLRSSKLITIFKLFFSKKL